MKGKFIVFEGVSGTGKETQAKLLKKFLERKKIITNVVFHPSPELKPLISEWKEVRQVDHITQVYLFLADRYDKVRQVINPALEQGEWVISLRSYVSAMVYQGKTRDEKIWIKNEFLRFEPKPDRLYYFDISPKIALERIKKRYQETGEKLGFYEKMDLLSEKRQAYKDVLQKMRHVNIDAGQTIENIHRQILSHLLLV
ncbi:MAG: dTMP kinase [Patescibacteria group bacterium]|mgnify:CR=1 FL=1